MLEKFINWIIEKFNLDSSWVENNKVDSGGGSKVTGNLAKLNNSLIWIPFFTLSNVNIQFAKKKITWRSYTVAKALPTTKRVEIINKKKFAKAALNKHVEVFVMYMTFLSMMAIHLARETQIVLQVTEEVKIPTKYSDFSDIFLEEKASILLEATDLNQSCQRFHLAFKVTRWCFYPLCRKARRQPPSMCGLLGSQ